MHHNENSQIEFKREYTSELKKEVVAFANSAGGEIFIGIDDNGEVVGVEDTDKTMLQITSMLRDAIKPEITLLTNCKAEIIENKSVIRLSVQRGVDRPYYIGEKGLKPSGVYIRHGSASIPVSNEAIRQMIKETDGDKFEDIRSLNQELTFETTTTEFSKKSIEFGKTQMKNLGIIGSDGLYTNLGLLLSDQCVHSIKGAIFQGTSKSIFKDRREFTGSILKQLNDIYKYIDLNNRTKATFSGLDRMDTRDYPQDAIREALLNAIVHRDYAFSASILISIFDDRIEFVSLGGLVAGLTINDIMVGASQSRNEKIANIFYRLRLIEAYGTGITKILMSYENNNSKPEFVVTDGVFCVKLPNINAHISVKASGMTSKNDKDTEIKLDKILDFLSQNESITRKEVENLLGVKQTMARNVLRKYEELGLIIAIGAGKNVKYIKKAD